ncbi:GntR family transcriptional regulator [Anaerobium acetethylicum]|uniref:GntR family transcriptional regulator n=1 Tax=Anaerobium acetethylicum TaxID=1619234 RepID=A0A1D3TW26_9FIRM|nr:GntR family transcriptional regulator [Anaerobium acetethylicum]SCP98401.1 GntR family transcriptional regulator [Anaerobium acetethylicum]
MITEAAKPSELKRANSTPLYVQLKNIIREKISTGEWEPNDVIPSENELSQIYGISRMTARSVITQLVTEGLLYRVPGKGTFVSEPKIEMSSLSYSGIRNQLENKGYKVETKLLDVTKVKCDDFLAKKLGITPGAEVFKINRVRSANGTPISYHKSFVPAELCRDLDQYDLANEQLCKILSDQCSLTPGKVTETLESYLADGPKAEILGVKPKFPLILLQDLISTSSGVIFEYTRVYFRGDKITLKIELNTQ